MTFKTSLTLLISLLLSTGVFGGDHHDHHHDHDHSFAKADKEPGKGKREKSNANSLPTTRLNTQAKKID